MFSNTTQSITGAFNVAARVKLRRGTSVQHQNFTGAEIEASIVSALYESFDDDKRELVTNDILNALEETAPLSVTMKEKIQALQDKRK